MIFEIRFKIIPRSHSINIFEILSKAVYVPYEINSEANTELAQEAPPDLKSPPAAFPDSAPATTTGVAYPKLYVKRKIAPAEQKQEVEK